MSSSTESDRPAKLQRTKIENISLQGYELSEAHLRLVSGGLRSDSAGSCCEPGMCDDE